VSHPFHDALALLPQYLAVAADLASASGIDYLTNLLKYLAVAADLASASGIDYLTNLLIFLDILSPPPLP
jgi:hypothetical protein